VKRFEVVEVDGKFKIFDNTLSCWYRTTQGDAGIEYTTKRKALNRLKICNKKWPMERKIK
jgi:hypothetical protein